MEIVKKFDALPKYKKYQCKKKSTGTVFRFQKESSEAVFVFAKGRSRYGWRYTTEQFLSLYEPIIKTPEEEDENWHRKIKRVINALEKSGLWPDLKVQFENLYKMSLQDRKAIIDLECQAYDLKPEEYNKAIENWADKYPFIVQQNPHDGSYYYNSKGYLRIVPFYIDEMSYVQTKSMYFGWQNKSIKEEIKKNLAEKHNYSTGRIRTNYDVTFEYDANNNKAWYSEEYKDCGNGHYYIALNESMALFVEND